MDFLDPANRAGLYQQRRQAVEARRVNLDAHLRHDALDRANSVSFRAS